MIIGDKKIFAIGGGMFDEPKDDQGIMNNSWGELFFWCNNKNLFAFKNNDPNRTYIGKLLCFVEYLCDNLSFLLTEGEDKFPYAIKPHQSATECLAENKIVPDDLNMLKQTLDVDKLSEKLIQESDWLSVHNVTRYHGGYVMPNINFLLRGDKIEISWDDTGLYDRNQEQNRVFFKYPKGCEYVPREVFKEVMLEFIESFLLYFEDYFPEEVDELRNKLYAREF